MNLKELFLDRFLYRDNEQDSGTKDSAFIAADSSEEEPVSIPAGGAAQDINTGNVGIDGSQIESGTLNLDVSSYGWGQTCAFSSTDLNTVSWGSGTFTSASGDSYSIGAGNTGNMSAKTYIYLDLNVSSTAYQITTVSATAVGIGKVLIAVAENAADDATYALSEAEQIVTDNIVANSIDASKMNVGQLSAISADVGTLTAGNITGLTVTGGTIRTATSGARVQMTGSNNYLQIFDSSRERLRMEDDSLYLYNSSGTQLCRLWADTGVTSLESSGAGYYLGLKTPSTGTYGILFQNGTTTVGQVNSNGIIVHNNLPIYPNGAYGGSVGTSTKPWEKMYATTYYFDRSGYTEKYIQMASDGASIDCNHKFYASGDIETGATFRSSDGRIVLSSSSISPSSAGELRNYASGATDQFRGVPGDGTWVGSFDMTAA